LAELTTGLQWLIHRGGPVMWPLLGVSVVTLAIVMERSWYWLRAHGPGLDAMLKRLAACLRERRWDEARRLAEQRGGLYGEVVLDLLDGGGGADAAMEAWARRRPSVERFMPLLSTVITGAPMLGILGTVIGIIWSFDLLSQAGSPEPESVSRGIGAALWSTAAGLVVALVALVPYNLYRAQVDAAASRVEVLAAAASAGAAAAAGRPRAGEVMPDSAGDDKALEDSDREVR